jgi:hypothetical protein
VIRLLTGQPGHGKTLRALWLALQEKKAGREVYACRVRGLDYEKTGFKELASLSEWQALPDGSVVLVDECYADVPARGPGKAPPAWEEALATHRHRGFDFILIAQLGSQISTFVRALVDSHVHVRRKWGFEKAVLIEWDRYQAAVSSDAEVKQARKVGWSYPREVFALYKSAEVHTAKRRLPWQLVAVPALVLVVAGCIWSVSHRMQARGAKPEAKSESAALAAPSTSPAKDKKKSEPMSVGAYIEQMTPRIPAMPWSAPWHDDFKPKAEPDIMCVDTEAKGCRCYTEQITPVSVPKAQCEQIAVHGIYNPFRQPPTQNLNTDYPAERPTRPPADRSFAAEGQRPAPSALPRAPNAPVAAPAAYESLPVPTLRF